LLEHFYLRLQLFEPFVVFRAIPDGCPSRACHDGSNDSRFPTTRQTPVMPTGWDNSDIIVGRITSDFAALITWRMAPDCPVGNRDVAERLIDWLLEHGHEAKAKAA
jgi:hypothetical protein